MGVPGTIAPVKVRRYNSVPSLSAFLADFRLYLKFLNTLLNDDQRVSNSVELVSLSVWWPGLLEQYNIGYTEKWIKRLDENFLMYHGGENLPLHTPPQAVVSSTDPKCLSEKSFSGDVSGMIAESLFIYLLEELGINIELVGHLRPQKKKDAFMPDFAVYDRGGPRCPLIANHGCDLPIYAEVKGSTGGINSGQINKAMAQLCKGVTRSSNCGLMFLVSRDPATLNYEAMLVEVGF